MKFTITNADYWFNDDKRKQVYEKYGMIFIETEEKYKSHGKWERKEDGTMEINSLDELMKMIKEVGPIVLDVERITIYDDYLE
jgi:chaperonin cofactor prefoldin